MSSIAVMVRIQYSSYWSMLLLFVKRSSRTGFHWWWTCIASYGSPQHSAASVNVSAHARSSAKLRLQVVTRPKSLGTVLKVLWWLHGCTNPHTLYLMCLKYRKQWGVDWRFRRENNKVIKQREITPQWRRGQSSLDTSKKTEYRCNEEELSGRRPREACAQELCQCLITWR